MDKQEIQSLIQEKEALIEALKTERKQLIKDLKNCPLSKREQLQNVLKYGGKDCYCIDYTNGGILESYVEDRQRHQNINIEYVIEYAFDGYICDEFEHQEEMEALFDYPFGKDNIMERYDKRKENRYVRTVGKHEFEDLADDIINANVKSFTYDW